MRFQNAKLGPGGWAFIHDFETTSLSLSRTPLTSSGPVAVAAIIDGVDLQGWHGQIFQSRSKTKTRGIVRWSGISCANSTESSRCHSTTASNLPRSHPLRRTTVVAVVLWALTSATATDSTDQTTEIEPLDALDEPGPDRVDGAAGLGETGPLAASLGRDLEQFHVGAVPHADGASYDPISGPRRRR